MNRVLRSHTFASGLTVSLVQGDITAEAVDAIVNAANNRLAHGGGVAGAIARRGGPAIQTESNAWVQAHGPVPHEKPAVTGAGRLPCKAVIHAVGPVWGAGGEDAKLRAAVLGALGAAADRGFVSLSLPAISTGIFGFPKERAARVILQAIEDFAGGPAVSLREIRIAILDDPTMAPFRTECEARWK
jgi:O-acetyl-ADP-ribose deacetylase (regulator of RNase III)